MKRIKILFILLGVIVLFSVTDIKADTYNEGGASASSNSCDTFTNELLGAKTGYLFDDATGKFTLEGKTYNESKDEKVIFYRTAKNGRTLYTYVLNYDKNSKLEEVESLNLPAFLCSKTYKTEKNSYPVSINGVTKPYISYALASSSNYNTIKLTYKMTYEVGYGNVTSVGYEIYKSKDNGKTYEKLINTKNSSYSETNLVTGVKSYYKIVPYVIWNGEKRIGEEYYIGITPKLKYPMSVKASSYNYNTIKVTWKKVVGATGYTLYKYNESTKAYSTVIVNTKNLYAVTSYKNVTGKTSYYKVRAYRVINNKKVYSDYSSKTYAKPVLSTPVVKAVKYKKGVAKISWNKVSGATGYALYRYNAKTKKYVYVRSIRTLYTLDKNLVRGKKYYYKVRSYRVVNGVKVYSNYSGVKSVYV